MQLSVRNMQHSGYNLQHLKEEMKQIKNNLQQVPISFEIRLNYLYFQYPNSTHL